MKKQTKIFQLFGVALMLSFATSTAIAGDVAAEQIDTGGLSLNPTVSYDTAYLRVSGEGLDVTTAFGSSDSIRIDSGQLADGTYSYELMLETNPSEEGALDGSSSSQGGDFAVRSGSAGNTEETISAEASIEDAITHSAMEAKALSSTSAD